MTNHTFPFISDRVKTENSLGTYIALMGMFMGIMVLGLKTSKQKFLMLLGEEAVFPADRL